MLKRNRCSSDISLATDCRVGVHSVGGRLCAHAHTHLQLGITLLLLLAQVARSAVIS